ncbi:hypothetical protein [Bergeyella zoohelcum]|uniref:Uncharacterized protein n=1 Tax=Bergeyella zoohelcum TaxID=1015 RepID=A0A376BXX9_9FLAO|nr:hypothetical protein [Bergeyella zoohelcum]EKB61412.1 hypothetical protein HMPREF9700_00907 [Bergeyella zoohelcum CCUG 30536]SSZ46496.1 Uncharacterised protein [Bergeyella zoohelcum]
MKRILLVAISAMFLVSCDFKDKHGNAPLIEDEQGRLVDNPNYKTDEEWEREEIKQKIKEELEKTRKDDGMSFVAENSEPTAEDRENFAKVFKPRSGKNEISLSGKDKTTITLTSGFNSEFTMEQFNNLNYFEKLRELGFKKVVFSNGKKTVATKDL